MVDLCSMSYYILYIYTPTYIHEPNERARPRFMLNRNRQMKGRV